MWKIGNVEIKNRVILAPMAGISNSAFRRIAKEMGVGLAYAEMVSDKAICYDNKKTIGMLYMTDFERPVSQQIFGNEPETMAKATKFVCENMKPDLIDINMGCPVPKVAVHTGAGSALLKNPSLIKEIVEAVVKASSVPVTVKIRSGWDNNHINAVEVAKICEEAGASAICVHPRTRSDLYRNKANWDIIREVKENVSIPVIGNGDIKTRYDAKRMIDETGCDAVMIGRACLGNPWLLKESIEFIENDNEIGPPSKLDRIDMCRKHFDYLLETVNENVAVLEIRNHISWYLKGLTNSNEIKNKVFLTKKASDIIDILDDYRKFIEEEV